MLEEKEQWGRFLLVAAHAASGNEGRLASTCTNFLEAGGKTQDCYDLFAFMAPFCGFPRSLAALRASRLVGGSRTSPRPQNRSAAHRAGKAMFQAVYGDLADRILARIEAVDAALAAILIEVPYGEFYRRPDWPLVEKELLACLFLTILECDRELAGHRIAARRLGAMEADLRQVEQTAVASREPAGSPLDR